MSGSIAVGRPRQAGAGRVEAWQSSLEQMVGLSQFAADQQIAIEQAKSGQMSSLILVPGDRAISVRRDRRGNQRPGRRRDFWR